MRNLKCNLTGHWNLPSSSLDTGLAFLIHKNEAIILDGRSFLQLMEIYYLFDVCIFNKRVVKRHACVVFPNYNNQGSVKILKDYTAAIFHSDFCKPIKREGCLVKSLWHHKLSGMKVH